MEIGGRKNCKREIHVDFSATNANNTFKKHSHTHVIEVNKIRKKM